MTKLADCHNMETAICRAFFLGDAFLTGDRLNLQPDSSGSVGYGAVYDTAWFHGGWPSSRKSRNISPLELFPLWLQ